MSNVTTNVYSISAQVYIRFMMLAFFRKWWLVFIIPLLFVLSLSVSDFRFIILFFIVLFILMPSLMMYLSFYYALDPECVVAIKQKQVVFNESSVLLHFTDDENKFVDKEYKLQEFSRFKKDNNNFYLYFSTYRFILVPFSSFSSAEDIDRTSKILFKRH